MIRRFLTARVCLTLGLMLAVAAAPVWSQRSPNRRGAAKSPSLLLGDTYPIEVSINSHAGLLHWLDSLTAMNGVGVTAGKTIAAHRAEYNKRLGQPSAEDQRVLLRYVEARRASVTENRQGNPNAITQAFLQAGTLPEALDALPALMAPKAADELRQALTYFAPRYQKIWIGGQVPRSFLQRVNTSSDRKAVARFLIDVARFYGVEPATDPPPRLTLVPVIDGHGTHAEAFGRHLLIEVRPWEGLSQQLGPIVHENAHFLFEQIAPERREALKAITDRQPTAWRALHEALPTAIAQGVACERFKVDGWSKDQPWYHLDDIDAYAKSLFDLVKTTLSEGGKLDEEFMRKALALYVPR